jgi:2-amino-4-hydroxy-6-hydroxymethyldihydropteridine diphosphokinase
VKKSSEHKSIAYIGLGSNLGDREKNIKSAVGLLKKTKEIKVNKVSSLYETEPRGYKEQGKFLNGALELETSLSPSELLRVLQGIEGKLGRRRVIKWGPRTIDLDILLYDDLEINEKNLKIPHPQMLRRDFVLIPLKEIASQKQIHVADKG